MKNKKKLIGVLKNFEKELSNFSFILRKYNLENIEINVKNSIVILEQKRDMKMFIKRIKRELGIKF